MNSRRWDNGRLARCASTSPTVSYERLLEKCREDGKITKEESEKLALQLDFLCSFFSNLRLKFWLIVAVILFVIAATFAVGSRVADSTALCRQNTRRQVWTQRHPSGTHPGRRNITA